MDSSSESSRITNSTTESVTSGATGNDSTTVHRSHSINEQAMKTAKSCTDKNGVSYQRSEKGFAKCQADLRKQGREQSGTVAPDSSSGMPDSSGDMPSDSSSGSASSS